MSAADFLIDIETRYSKLKPKISTNPPSQMLKEIEKLSDLEKSYYFDMKRLIDEIKFFRSRYDDFIYVLEKIPQHDLVSKVRRGPLEKADRE